MKKYLVCSLLAAAMILSRGVLADEGEGQAAPKAAAAAPAAKTAGSTTIGEISALDATAGTLTVKNKRGEKELKTDASTKVSTASKQDATLADLKVGDKVSVKYETVGGAMIAKTIKPLAAKAAAPAGKGAAVKGGGGE